MKKALLSVLAIALLLIAGGAIAQEITLEVWMTDFNEDTVDLFKTKLIPEFEKRYPNIKLNAQFVSWDDFDVKLITSFAAGVSPDVFQAGTDWAGRVSEEELCIKLNDRLEEWGQKDDFYPASWEVVVWKGDVLGIPALTAPRPFIYRKDIFREVGLDTENLPLTWDWFVDATKKLTVYDEHGKITRAGFEAPSSGMYGYQQWSPFFWQLGGRFLNEDNTSAVNGPEGVEALEFYADLFNKHKVVPRAGMQAEGGVPLFPGGKIATAFGGTWMLSQTKKYKPDKYGEIGVEPCLKNKEQWGAVFTDWMGLSTQSKHPDEAWDFITFFMEMDNLNAYNATMFFLPPIKSAATSEYMQDPLLQKYAESMAFMRNYPLLPEFTKFRIELGDALEQAIYERKSAKQTLDDFAEKFNKELKKRVSD